MKFLAKTETTGADIALSDEQARVFAELESTLQHVFVTGRAGTGKSTLLNYFVEHTSKRVAVLAPTGVAALLVGGQTIHSFFKFPIGVIADHDTWLSKQMREMYRNLDTLIIDEVSMVNADLMDAVDRALKKSRRNYLPFGGVQIVLFGDPYQLSPVPPREAEEKAWFQDNYASLWFFDAKVWADADLKVFELTEIHRQSDDEFKRLLNAVRYGTVIAEQAHVLNSTGARRVPEPSPIVLATTNATVNRINNRELAKLPGDTVSIDADTLGDFGGAYPADPALELKIGAQVMFLRNDPDGRWVNGTVGIVTDLRDNIWVEIDGETVEVTPTSWEKMRYSYDPEHKELTREVVGEFTQFPLRLAWAVTIHKSQGQTYDSAVIDLGQRAFSPGQVYVALSRIRELDGLYLSRDLRPSDVIVDQRVREFMLSRYVSEEEETAETVEN